MRFQNMCLQKQNLWPLLSRVRPEMVTKLCLCLTNCQPLWQDPNHATSHHIQLEEEFQPGRTWRTVILGTWHGSNSLLRPGNFVLVGWREGCEKWTSSWHKEVVLVTVYFTHKSSACLSDKRWFVPSQTQWYCGIGWGGFKRCLASANVWAWRRACQILLGFIEVKKPWHSSSGPISQVRLKFCACSWLAFCILIFINTEGLLLAITPWNVLAGA